MKRLKGLNTMSLKKKRTLIAGAIALAVLVIGGTIAYNQDSMFFSNLFHLATNEVSFEDIVPVENNWQPCQEIPKTATATNHNDTPRYVRMKINKYWRTNPTQTSTDDHETTDLPLTWNDSGTTKEYGIVNFQNETDWEQKSDGWYYYKTTLAKDETTNSLLKSVILNCDANLVDGVTYSQDGKTGESNPSDYASSTFHVFVTFQMSDEEIPEDDPVINCDNPTLLYDKIACLTNGPDTNVDFSEMATGTTNADGTFSGTNGFGVNTVDAHKDDTYPTYYYRGKVATNHVLFANNCWQAVRTTSTGGVKLIFDGRPSATGNCSSSYDERQSSYYPALASFSSVNNDSLGSRYTMHALGYMHGSPNDHELTRFDYSPPSGASAYYAKDVEWNGSSYSLIDTIEITQSNFGQHMNDLLNTYHYRCTDMFRSTGCSEVYYVYMPKVEADYAQNGFMSILFRNGGTHRNLFDEALKYTTDSDVKSAIDRWYVNGDREVNGTISAAQEYLEDTVFCSDTQVMTSAIKSPSLSAVSTNAAYFGAGARLFMPFFDSSLSVSPSVDCAQKRDQWTVSEANGNGQLTYPVGLISADELIYAGVIGFKSLFDDYRDTDALYRLSKIDSTYLGSASENSNSWTMTPAFNNSTTVRWYAYNSKGYLFPYRTLNSAAVRPVISLKPGSVVSSGDGSGAAPYVIQQ